jgi:hypothetical protein
MSINMEEHHQNHDATIIHENSSVADQIIAEFLSTLENHEKYGEIALRLKTTILKKPTEATIKRALFGEDSL